MKFDAVKTMQKLEANSLRVSLEVSRAFVLGAAKLCTGEEHPDQWEAKGRRHIAGKCTDCALARCPRCRRRLEQKESASKRNPVRVDCRRCDLYAIGQDITHARTRLYLTFRLPPTPPAPYEQ